MKTVYLLHFTKPYKHARHYIGFTTVDVRFRVGLHRKGKASPLTRAVIDSGGDLLLARVWNGDRNDERRLKKQGGASRNCPICRRRKASEVGEYLSVKRKTYTEANAPCKFECAWCGQKKKRLYAYGDRSYVEHPRRLFCDKSCAGSYEDWPESSFGPLPVEPLSV